MINDLLKMAVLGLALVACAGDKDGTDTDVSDTDTDAAPDTDVVPDTDDTDVVCDSDCTSYCTTFLSACGTDTVNNTYTDQADCEATCAGFTCGTAADDSGDTLGCRAYHATAAVADPTTHCPHAGETPSAVCI